MNWEAVGAPFGSFSWDQWQNSTVAAECALWLCVQSFRSRQDNSQKSQVVTTSFSSIHRRTTDPVAEISFLDIPAEMNPPPDQKFGIDGLASKALSDYLLTLFNGEVILGPGAQQYTTDLVQAVWNASSDLNSWMQTVATSMTNVIRTYDTSTQSNSNHMYNGTGYRLGYDVRWRWITIPALLVGSSVLILITIMIKTARSPVHAWKGSPLALLFINADHGLRDRAAGQMDHPSGIKNAIGKNLVVVGQNDDGRWRVKQA